MRRGLKGFALAEYAEKMLADASRCAKLEVDKQSESKLEEGSKEEVRTLVIDSHTVDGSKEEATKQGVEGHTPQENEPTADERLRREPNARLLG